MIRLVLLRLLESYFRHRWLNLVPMLLMGALAVVFTLRAPQTYVSGGVLFVQNDTLLSSLVPIGNSGWSWSTPAQITANELRELLWTEAFVRFAIQRTDLETQMQEGPEAVQGTIAEFRQSVTINVVGEKLVGFAASHPNPEIAHQIATATIEAYTEWKLNSERQESLVAQAFFAQQLEPHQQALDQARAELQAYLVEHPAPVRGDRPEEEQIEITRLQAAVADASQQVKDTLSKEQDARLALSKAESNASQAYTVIDAPVVPTEPAGSLMDLIQKSAIFVVVGIVLSGACVVGGMFLDRTFRLPIDVRHGVDLPVLALVPVARLTAAQAATDDERQHIVRDYAAFRSGEQPVALHLHGQHLNGHNHIEAGAGEVEIFPEVIATEDEPQRIATTPRKQPGTMVKIKDQISA